MGGKNLKATPKDNARSARRHERRQSSGRLTPLQKAAIKAAELKKKQEEYLVKKALKDNAKAKKEKERLARRKRR